ncbi:hypothetical protein [Streptomyces sp. NPDC004285]
MSLQFIDVDPESGQTGSPTAWVDEKTRDIVVQSYTADEETRTECVEKNAPGHDKVIPDGESVIRLSAHMIPILREACDAAERAAVR